MIAITRQLLLFNYLLLLFLAWLYAIQIFFSVFILKLKVAKGAVLHEWAEVRGVIPSCDGRDAPIVLVSEELRLAYGNFADILRVRSPYA